MAILKVIFNNSAYGRCDHNLSCEILKEFYPDYNITWSNDGY